MEEYWKKVVGECRWRHRRQNRGLCSPFRAVDRCSCMVEFGIEKEEEMRTLPLATSTVAPEATASNSHRRRGSRGWRREERKKKKERRNDLEEEGRKEGRKEEKRRRHCAATMSRNLPKQLLAKRKAKGWCCRREYSRGYRRTASRCCCCCCCCCTHLCPQSAVEANSRETRDFFSYFFFSNSHFSHQYLFFSFLSYFHSVLFSFLSADSHRSFAFRRISYFI